MYSTKADSCASAMFLQKPIAASLCNTYIVKKFLPIFIEGEGQWIISTSHPVKLYLNCPANPLAKLTKTVNGTGMLTLSQGCSAHSNSLPLPAHDTVNRGPPLEITQNPLPLSLPLAPTEEHWNLENVPNLTTFDGEQRSYLLQDLMSSL